MIGQGEKMVSWIEYTSFNLKEDMHTLWVNFITNFLGKFSFICFLTEVWQLLKQTVVPKV